MVAAFQFLNLSNFYACRSATSWLQIVPRSKYCRLDGKTKKRRRGYLCKEKTALYARRQAKSVNGAKNFYNRQNKQRR